MYALTLQMLRRLPLLILTVALILAIEPVVHSHPLWENSDARSAATSSACAVCAAGTTQLPTVAPSIAAPIVVVTVLVVQTVWHASASIALPLASRAPPAA